LVSGVFQFDELKGFLNARLDLFFFNVLFAETIRYIFADGHGIEERAFLKNETDALSKMQEFLFGHGGNFLAEDRDTAASGFEEAGSEFEG
jgi:hypothetical protein